MNRRACWISFAVTLVTMLIGCNQGGENSPNIKPKAQPNASRIVSATAVPRINKGELSQEALLKRFRGQTEFLTPLPYSGSGLRAASAESANAPLGGARKEQEADIFKIGKSGSKLLYLLNNYRGLQVVSFAKGSDKPELLGRVKATGNYPREMYFDEKSDRLLVLERLYYDESGNWNYSTQQSRLLVYDVKKPNQPRIAMEVPIKGEVADSRIVGDVLYVASSIRPNAGDSRETATKGVVTSFNLAKSTIEEVASYQLALPAVRGELMNIQAVQQKDGSYKYYLIAVMSETGWGWWDRKSLVEVIDISDERGQISPVMTISAKGRIRERSQTAIFGSTLIATSNYEVEGRKNSQGGVLTRIAVETFNLPKSDTGYLTERQAQLRQLQIEEALVGKSGEEYDKALEALLSDEKIGLRGYFMQTSDRRVRKLVADSVDTRGDTNGLSTSLQDVRYQNGLLYAFWVPTNNQDPLDVFDISNPENGVKYLGRLLFEGWVERAEPFMVGDRRFILGLGWIVPSDSSRGMGRPQATVFEITQKGKTFDKRQVAQITFADTNIWTDFNSADKYIEVRTDANGVGQVLFSASRWNESSYDSGGKILNFNLSKIVNDKPEEALQEGVFLAGNSGWLRRVFTNNEIDRVNTFSDQALGVFNTATLSQDKTVKAVAVLELARQIQEYESISLAGKTYGIQLVSDWSWYGNVKSQTALRLVPGQKADAELPEILASVTLEGAFESSVVDSDGRIYVLTNLYLREPAKDKPNKFIYKNINYLYIITAELGEKPSFKVSSQSWELTQNSFSSELMLVGGRRSRSDQLVKLADGTVLVRIEGQIHMLASKALKAEAVALKGCVTKDRRNVRVREVNDRLVLTSSEFVKLDENDQVLKNFMAMATLENKILSCGTEVNIPGDFLTIADGAVITDDLWVMDVINRESSWKDGNNKTVTRKFREFKTVRSLTGLSIKDGKAILTDQIENNDRGFSSKAISLRPGQLVNVTSFSNARGFDGLMPHFRGGRPGAMSEPKTDPAFEIVQIDSKGLLTRELCAMPLEAGRAVNLLGIERDPRAQNQYLLVLNRGSQVQVMSWSQASRRPELVKLTALNENFEMHSEADSVRMVDRYSYYGSKGYHFTPALLSFEMLGGLSGIQQFFIK